MGMNFFKDYDWHSALELDDSIKGRKIIRKVTATEKNLSHFLRVANNSSYCIHKSTKDLWRISDDGRSIEPVFPDDILTEEEF